MFEDGGYSARSWSAPVLWRFGSVRGMDKGLNLVLSLSTLEGKAVEGYRTLRRCRDCHDSQIFRQVLEFAAATALLGSTVEARKVLSTASPRRLQ